MIQYDSVLIYWSIILLAMTAKGLASSSFILIHVLFPLLRDPLIYALGKLGVVRGKSNFLNALLQRLTIFRSYATCNPLCSMCLHDAGDGVRQLCRDAVLVCATLVIRNVVFHLVTSLCR